MGTELAFEGVILCFIIRNTYSVFDPFSSTEFLKSLELSVVRVIKVFLVMLMR